MKRTTKFFAFITAVLLLFCCALCVASAEEQQSGVTILFTNDIHCATEHYATLAAYRAQLINEGRTVITVDSGDAVQGEMIGTLTEGSAIIEVMNALGYDYAAVGNHEFDYTVPTLLSLAESANFEYLSANFFDLTAQENVFSAYAIKEANGKKYAFIGISTPETPAKSTPSYFQNENGEFIYSFMPDSLYQCVQSAVDSAKAEGAETIIAVGHLGITGVTEGWRSIDVIANTAGIDIFLDAHAHEYIESAEYTDKDGKSVLFSSTGTKLQSFGRLDINENGVTAQLIDPNTIDISLLSEPAREAHAEVKAIIDAYNAEFEYLFEEIGESEVLLTVYDENGKRRVRSAETNAGNFVADAYRAVLGTDIAFVNGGGVRADVPKGVFNRKSIMDINPWGNEMCVIEVTGQQLIDALEYGTHASPNEYGSFPQVSGISYELHSYIKSSVVIDELDNFISIDENAPRRVRNVKINGKDVDPNAKYSLAGSVYMLKSNGYTMFKDTPIIAQEGLLNDSDTLIEYVTNHLDGKISADTYGNIYGDGRMTVFETDPNDIDVGDSENTVVWIILSLISLSSAVSVFKVKK